ncbi:MAG: hypothetical protein ACK5KQ_01855 [Anaerorhabdus sp.]
MNKIKKIFFATLLVISTGFFSQTFYAEEDSNNEYENIIEEIAKLTGAPENAVEESVNEIATSENLEKLNVAKILLKDMENEMLEVDTRKPKTKKGETIPSLQVGDIYYSKVKTSFYNHGHVWIYNKESSIVHAPGPGLKVRVTYVSDIPSESGDLILGVSSYANGTTRTSLTKREDAAAWAKSKEESPYAYTVDNKSCGDNDYNCSQLVWCAYKKTGDNRDLDSDGTWFVSPADIKDSKWTFVIWRK